MGYDDDKKEEELSPESISILSALFDFNDISYKTQAYLARLYQLLLKSVLFFAAGIWAIGKFSDLEVAFCVFIASFILFFFLLY